MVLDEFKNCVPHVRQHNGRKAQSRKLMIVASIFSVQAANIDAFQKLLGIIRQDRVFDHDSRNFILQQLLYASCKKREGSNMADMTNPSLVSIQECITPRTEKLLYEHMYYDKFQYASACWLASFDGKVLFEEFDREWDSEQYISADGKNALIASMRADNYSMAETLLRANFSRELLMPSVTEACWMACWPRSSPDMECHLELTKRMIEICTRVAGLEVELTQVPVRCARAIHGGPVVRLLCECGVDPNVLLDYAEATSEFRSALITIGENPPPTRCQTATKSLQTLTHQFLCYHLIIFEF
jgi:hypothetical protein